ncbi:DUF2834 domain-containing protein [Calothrix sp. 336/3]|uniref:DUF2834 domain-containing protein n=1 Tax=Calothrix sp. 336/3 TaxID=1337936 RepID=UPI0006249C82|nr:DUF2834 domain-containing protein [Calothrix sp. 336/3]AKG20094.1 hypothetical protein IJ00_01120 [Calothrix sp. 336/3]
MLQSTNISAKKSFNSIKTLYLLLAIAGSITPWFWALQDPTALVSLPLFFQRAFANNIAAIFASDLIISGLVFFGFVWVELKRLGTSRWWAIAYVALTLGIGLSCALPCFLYHREKILENDILR